MYTCVYVSLRGELLWVGCRPKCECVCKRVLGTGPGQSECDACFGETWGAGDTGGQHTLPPVPQSTPGTREPARQLCKFPHWARGGFRAAMLQPEWESTSEGQRAEAEHRPPPLGGGGVLRAAFLQLLPSSPDQPGTTEEAGGKRGLPGSSRAGHRGAKPGLALWPRL